jgi:hypothetical protein
MQRIVALWMLVLMVGATAMAADPPASAAITQSKADLVFADFPSRFADGNCLQGLPRPEILEGEKKPAFCKSDKPLLFDAHHSPMPVKLLLDEAAGPGKGYDTLYVDFDDDGDFTNNPVYKPTPLAGTMFPGAEPVVLYFRDVHMPRNRKQGTSAHVQIFIEQWPGWPRDITALHPRIVPQRWAVGEVTVGGKRVPAAVIDRNWDETYVDKRGLDLAEYRAFPRGDYLVLGLGGESRLQPCDLKEGFGSARFVLTEYLVIDEQAYQVRAEKVAGGVRLELVPVQLPMGTLHFRLPLRVDRIRLIGTKTCAIVHDPGQDLRLPADTYITAATRDALLVVRPGEIPPREPGKAGAATRSSTSPR